jgi:hypothetical protein
VIAYARTDVALLVAQLALRSRPRPVGGPLLSLGRSSLGGPASLLFLPRLGGRASGAARPARAGVAVEVQML